MRRRAALLMATMTIALMVASGVVLAADITCPNSIGNRCVGTNEADTMTGTGQDDDMEGLGGADTMLARGGADTLFGGGGNDDISAGSGDDPSVKGGTGDDLLSGESGNDTYVFRIRGSWGADRIPADGEGAGMGTDELGFALLTDSLQVDLVSSANRDEVASDAGMLNFPPAVEIENVSGGAVRDIIRGNDLPNRLSGGGGNDELVGRDGDDTLSGGQGADALDGGEGSIDELIGGIGNDAYFFQSGWGGDHITDDAISGGTNRLHFGQLTSSVTVDLTIGKAYETTASSSFDDSPNRVNWTPGVTDSVTGIWTPGAINSVTSGTADDTLYGDRSDNTLNGQGGDDDISGGDGNDTIFGGSGVDTVYGDSPDPSTATGDDTIDVADGDRGDTVDCGPNATLSGDKVEVDAEQDPSGAITRVDSVTNCETVNEVLIN